MRILYVWPNVTFDPVNRRLVERHMLGWAKSCHASNVNQVDIAFLGSFAHADETVYARGFASLLADVLPAERYHLSPALLPAVLQADIVHVFSPFVLSCEAALVLCEALAKPSVVTDYGPRRSALSVRSDARHVVRNVIEPSEMAASAFAGVPSVARRLAVPAAPLSPVRSGRREPERVLLLHPDARSVSDLLSGEPALRQRQLVCLADLVRLEIRERMAAELRGDCPRFVVPASLETLLSFYTTVAEVSDLAAEAVVSGGYGPGIRRLARAEAGAAGARVRDLTGDLASAPPAPAAQRVGDQIVAFYSAVLEDAA